MSGASPASPDRVLNVGGVTPFSASDWPGQLAAVVFVQGCPWRCGYCHNPHLQARTPVGALAWDTVLELLRRRRGLLDAVVFSGGEPTIDPALGAAMAQARALGYRVGLHTACIYPRRLEEVLPLADWVGFDIKAPFADYARIAGVPGSGDEALACAEMILASGVAHECRTTIHPALLADEDLLALAGTLAGLGVNNYVLQLFRNQGCATSLAALGRVFAADYPRADTLRRIAALFPSFTLRADD